MGYISKTQLCELIGQQVSEPDLLTLYDIFAVYGENLIGCNKFQLV